MNPDEFDASAPIQLDIEAAESVRLALLSIVESAPDEVLGGC